MRKKLCVIEPLKWILYNLLSTILPYLYITYVLNTSDAQTAAYVAMIPALSTLSWRTSDAVELIVSLAKESAFVTNLREFLAYEPKTDKEIYTWGEFIDAVSESEDFERSWGYSIYGDDGEQIYKCVMPMELPADDVLIIVESMN